MASAEPPPILRFPLVDKGDEFFLLEATPYGSKPLDLKLRGSEGSAVFAAKRELPLPPSPFPFPHLSFVIYTIYMNEVNPHPIQTSQAPP